DVLHTPMSPRRQNLVLEDPTLLRPAALLLGHLLVKLEQRVDGVAVCRTLVLLLRSWISAARDPPSLLVGSQPRFRETEIRKASQRESALPPVVPIQQAPGLHAVGRDPKREARHLRVEVLDARLVGRRAERRDRACGERKDRHSLIPDRTG